VQEVLGVADLVLCRGCLRAFGGDGLSDSVGQVYLALELVVTAGECVQGAVGQGGDVTGESVRGVGGVKLVVLDQGGLDVLEAGGQFTGDEVLVDAPLKIRHRGKVAFFA
jgi:hypothetical protein